MVTAAIFIKNGRILIAQRPSFGEVSDKWELPGGNVEPGETLEGCLQRQMKEKFGIDIEVGELFCENVYEYGHGTIKLTAFRVSWNDGEIVLTAHDDFRWVDIGELGSYDFATADIPIFNKIMEGRYGD